VFWRMRPGPGPALPPYSQFDPAGDNGVVDIANLLLSLQNNDVIITTVNPTGTQPGDITVMDPIDLDGTDGNWLTLQASPEFPSVVCHTRQRQTATAPKTSSIQTRVTSTQLAHEYYRNPSLAQ